MIGAGARCVLPLFLKEKNMNIDPKFTKQIQDWLNKEQKDNDDVIAGAQLLQRINPKNVAYRRFVTLAYQRPEKILPKIIYELNIHLKYRLNGLTLQEVNRLDKTVIPESERIITEGQPEQAGEEVPPTAPRLGRREDHESLPEDIKKLWENNGKLYKDIKALFEELKSMEDLPSCQRYDKLQLLADMDKKYFAQMKQYDDYIITPLSDKVKDKEDDKGAAPQDNTKNIQSARSYISKNQSKLAELLVARNSDPTIDNLDAYENLLQKMQERIDILQSAGEVSDKMREALEPLGIVFNAKNDGEDRNDTKAIE